MEKSNNNMLNKNDNVVIEQNNKEEKDKINIDKKPDTSLRNLLKNRFNIDDDIKF